MTRYGRLLDDILRKNRHASDEEILGFLDGELTPRQTEWVRRHMEGCWSCRAAAERTAQTVAGFVHYREDALSQKASSWPDGRQALAARLRDLPASAPASTIPRGFLVAVPVFGVLAVGFLVLRLTSAPPVSAAMVLENARRVELSPATPAGRVAYRKLTVRRSGPSAPAQSAVYEVWADASASRIRHSGSKPLLSELDAIFAANGRSKPPLSASAFETWRTKAGARSEEVLAETRGGADVFTIKTRIEGPLGANGIREGRIVIRSSDWTPVAEAISVGDQDRSRLYEFEAVEALIVDRAAMPEDASPSSETPKLLASAFVSSGAVPASPELPSSARPGLLEEVAAHYALHRLGACLDGATAIVPRDGELVLEGIVENAERRSEFERAFADIPAVRLELQSASGVGVPPAAAQESPAAIAAMQSKQPPLHPRLREYLRTHPGEGTEAERAAKLANRAVSHAREVRQNAWAIRRLAERFGGSADLSHSAPARWLLEVMIRDHARTLEAEAGSLNQLLWPVLAVPDSAEVPPDSSRATSASWIDLSRAVFKTMQEVEPMIHVLFAGAGEAPLPEDALMRLGARLTDLHQQTRRLAGSFSSQTSQETIP